MPGLGEILGDALAQAKDEADMRKLVNARERWYRLPKYMRMALDALILAGERISAVQLYRHLTFSSLAEAKAMLDQRSDTIAHVEPRTLNNVSAQGF